MLVSAGAILSGMAELNMVIDIGTGAYATDQSALDAMEASDTRQIMVGIVQFCLSIAYFILFFIWICQTNTRVHENGARNLTSTPGWAVGRFFVPLACLWLPYVAMCELWQASKNPLNWQIVPRGPLLSLWWFMWFARFLVTYRALKMDYAEAETLWRAEVASALGIASSAFDLANYLIA